MTPRPSPERFGPAARLARRHLLFPTGYVAAAEVGHLLSFPGDFASFWPPSGVYLAALLVLGPCRWPVVVLAALAGNLTSDVLFHGKPVLVSVGFWTANTLEALIGAAVLRRAAGGAFSVTSVRNVLWLVGVTALLSTAVSASVGAGVIALAFGGSYWAVWPVWWSSGTLGVLMVAPALVNLLTCNPWRELTQGWRPVEAVAVVVLTGCGAEFVFGLQDDPLAYVLMPLIVAAALRLRVCGAVLATTVLALVVVLNTTAGYGPFAGGRPVSEQVLLTQIFLAAQTGLALVLAALMMERRAAVAAADAARRELEAANAELRRLATTDALTGVFNRGAFQQKLAEEVERAARYATPLSVVLLDVDHFKRFNDTHGHPAGDEVLRAVARLLREAARGIDVVARYGGEEFVVLLPQTDRDGAVVVAERFRRVVADADWPLRAVTASFGVAAFGPDVADGAALVKQADNALYSAKRGGRNRVSHDGRSGSVAALVRGGA